MATRSEYLERIRLLEKTETVAPWGLVHIRELDADQRVEAARQEDEARGDSAYNAATRAALWAFVITRGLLDEPKGRPLFSDADILELRKRRPSALEALGKTIWDLSEVGPDSLKSGDPAPDAGQLDAEGGAPSPRSGRARR
jgi:hypothetical protein